MLGFSVCARGRPGLHNFTTITSPHGDASCRCGSTLRPTPARFNHTAMAKPVHKTAHPFDKAHLEALLNRRFFYAPAFEIYEGPSHPFSLADAERTPPHTRQASQGYTTTAHPGPQPSTITTSHTTKQALEADRISPQCFRLARNRSTNMARGALIARRNELSNIVTRLPRTNEARR